MQGVRVPDPQASVAASISIAGSRDVDFISAAFALVLQGTPTEGVTGLIPVSGRSISCRLACPDCRRAIESIETFCVDRHGNRFQNLGEVDQYAALARLEDSGFSWFLEVLVYEALEAYVETSTTTASDGGALSQ